MRKDHRPFWLKQLFDKLNRLYIDHFLVPQLDHCGVDFRVMYPRSLQLSGAGISIGDHVYVMALDTSPVRIASFGGTGDIRIGSFSIINPGVRVTSASRIEIGEGCMLAMNCYLSDSDWHDLQHRIYAPGKTAPITLEDNVWIGDSALVAKGVRVGENSVVGAWSVVTKDVPPNSIVAGNPARIVGAIDPDDMTTRHAMFNGEVSYERFESEHVRAQLSGNTLFGWIKAVMAPGKMD